MKRYLILILLVIFLFPSVSLAEDKSDTNTYNLKTGIDLYRLIKMYDSATSVTADLSKLTEEQLKALSDTVSYLRGFLDSLIIEGLKYERLSEEEKKYTTKMGLVNMPQSIISVEQLMMIYKKYAEQNPEHLNMKVYLCLDIALGQAYGYK